MGHSLLCTLIQMWRLKLCTCSNDEPRLSTAYNGIQVHVEFLQAQLAAKRSRLQHLSQAWGKVSATARWCIWCAFISQCLFWRPTHPTRPSSIQRSQPYRRRAETRRKSTMRHACRQSRRSAPEAAGGLLHLPEACRCPGAAAAAHQLLIIPQACHAGLTMSALLLYLLILLTSAVL